MLPHNAIQKWSILINISAPLPMAPSTAAASHNSAPASPLSKPRSGTARLDTHHHARLPAHTRLAGPGRLTSAVDNLLRCRTCRPVCFPPGPDRTCFCRQTQVAPACVRVMTPAVVDNLPLLFLPKLQPARMRGPCFGRRAQVGEWVPLPVGAPILVAHSLLRTWHMMGYRSGGLGPSRSLVHSQPPTRGTCSPCLGGRRE